jgi:hypothetical protein
MLVHELTAAIEEKRELMMNSARALGFANEQTIKHSEDLDALIVLFMKHVRTF